MYRDQGPVELCLAGLLLVPRQASESEGSAGWCTPPADEAAPCQEDSECQSRERCLCGRCSVPFCTLAADCRAGEACIVSANRCGRACALDEDCAPGEACDRGRCAARCGEDRDCQHGEQCSRLRDVCVSNFCESDDDCSDEERCDGQRAERDLHEPAVIESSDELTMLVEDRARQIVLVAASKTAARFEVESIPALEQARAPAPLATSEGLVVFYAAPDRSAILRSRRRADGSFEAGEIVLEPTDPWEGGWVDAPCAALVEGSVVLAYEAAGGIGTAELSGSEIVVRAGPVVATQDLEDPFLWRAVRDLGSPMLMSSQSGLGEPRLRLWVDAQGAEGSLTVLGEETAATPVNASIAYLESADRGRSFVASPFNPTFARVAELGRYKAESEPWVLRRGESYLIYFYGADVADGQVEGIGLGTTE